MKDSMSIAKMLILVVTVFLTIEIPKMVITALHALSTETNQLLDYEIAENIVLFINTFTCLTVPLNLFIYCGMSKQFRDTFHKLFIQPLKKSEVLCNGTPI
jgi:hypothetical protein